MGKRGMRFFILMLTLALLCASVAGICAAEDAGVECVETPAAAEADGSAAGDAEVECVETPAATDEVHQEPEAATSEPEPSQSPEASPDEDETAAESAPTYSITYVLNGGVNSEANPGTYASNEAIQFADATKEGYTFAGWYSDRKLTKRITGIDAGSTKNLTVYAKWKVNNYVIAFDGNGADNTPAYSQKAVYDKSLRLTSNKYSLRGYTFAGWSLEPDGSEVLYTNKQSVKNLCAEPDGTVTLYAQWKINSYSIVYVLNGGVNAPGNPTSYTVEDELQLADPTRAGYTFVGWYSDRKLTKPASDIGAMKGSKITLYAKWKANTYSFVFYGGKAGNDAPYIQTMTSGKSGKLLANRYSLVGYQFKGWATEADGSGSRYSNMQRISGIDVENGTVIALYAQWEANRYSIAYVLNGGVNAPGNPTSYTVEDELQLADPTRAGYTFVGWYSDRKLTKPVSDIGAMKGSKITLYAKWMANTFTFVFYGGEAGNDAPYSQTMTSGKNEKLLTNRYSLEGYQFTGWTTEPDGTGSRYSNMQLISGVDVENGAVIELYAQWRANLKKITFNGVEYYVVNTPTDVVQFSEKTYHSVCQAPNETGTNIYPGKCLNFSYYYVYCLLNGVTEPDLAAGARGKTDGKISVHMKEFRDSRDLLNMAYDLLNNGKPQILMVEAVTHADSRHFLALVGYKTSVTSRETMTVEDLLLIDSFDGTLESMDPAISPTSTRVLYKQKGLYKLGAVY